jgi:hypothetical protein
VSSKAGTAKLGSSGAAGATVTGSAGSYNALWQNKTDEQVERLWLNILKFLSPPKQCQVPIPDRIN